LNAFLDAVRTIHGLRGLPHLSGPRSVDETTDAHRSLAIGIGSTARVITTAAAIMISVFSSFVLDPDPTVKMLAVGMAAAVLIDASVIRMILVPAVMSLLERHAWWIPKWLDRITPDLDIEGSEHGNALILIGAGHDSATVKKAQAGSHYSGEITVTKGSLRDPGQLKVTRCKANRAQFQEALARFTKKKVTYA
jgi:hypothetical protein